MTDYTEPTVTEKFEHGETITTSQHPAYGLIGAGRISSSAGISLFGSPIKHHDLICITIQTGYAESRLQQEWHYPDRIVTELYLSEAQWAAFVSTLNVGSGVPCTLRFTQDGGLLPGIADTNSWHAKQQARIKQAVADDLIQLKKAMAVLDQLLLKPSVSRRDLQMLRKMFIQPVDNGEANGRFTAEALNAHAEELVVAVKAEINAMVTRMAVQYPQLQGHAPELKGVEDKRERPKLAE